MSKFKKFIFSGMGFSISAIKEYVKSWLKQFNLPRDVNQFLQRLQNIVNFTFLGKHLKTRWNSSLWKSFIYGLENVVSWGFLNWQIWEEFLNYYLWVTHTVFSSNNQIIETFPNIHFQNAFSRARVSFKKWFFSHELLNTILHWRNQLNMLNFSKITAR